MGFIANVQQGKSRNLWGVAKDIKYSQEKTVQDYPKDAYATSGAILPSLSPDLMHARKIKDSPGEIRSS